MYIYTWRERERERILNVALYSFTCEIVVTSTNIVLLYYIIALVSLILSSFEKETLYVRLHIKPLRFFKRFINNNNNKLFKILYKALYSFSFFLCVFEHFVIFVLLHKTYKYKVFCPSCNG